MVTFLIPFTHGTRNGHQEKENWSTRLRGTPLQGDPYKKFFSEGPRALAYDQGALEQPINLLLGFQPRARMNQ
jgi:hypothetical protein